MSKLFDVRVTISALALQFLDLILQVFNQLSKLEYLLL